MPEVPAYEPVATLYYGAASVQDLMADLDTLARGQPAGAVIRVRGPDPEILALIPAWCAQHGWHILQRGDTWETELLGAPRWAIAGYRFDIQKATGAADTPLP
jgi:hypothetical protein